MEIIACAGQLCTGKDVLCDHLCEWLNKISHTDSPEKLWKRDAFANAVKKVFTDSFGLDKDFIEKWKRSNEIPPGFLKPVRQSLQFIGDGFRQIKDEIWIDIALRDKNRIILSDARYINEAKKVREEGGIIILLHRPGYLNDDPNPSESQIRPIVEFCINNIDEGPMPNFAYLKSKFGQDLPEGIQYYDYFMVNDEDTIKGFYNKINCTLVGYLSQVYKERL